MLLLEIKLNYERINDTACDVKVVDIEQNVAHIFQEEEIYWPDENTSVTLGHTTVTHKGTEVKDATTTLKLEIKRFGQVAEYRQCCYIII